MHKAPCAEVVNDRAKLLMHRIAARQLSTRPDLLVAARSAVSHPDSGPEHIAEWQAVLELDISEIRRILTSRTERMDRLRLSSPFALVVDFKDPALRRRIRRLARKGLIGQPSGGNRLEYAQN